MKQILLLKIIFVLYLFPCIAQETKIIQNETHNYKTISKIIKTHGWNLPILEEKDLFPPQSALIENYPVVIQSYKLKTPVDLNLDFYAVRAADNSLVSFSKNIETTGFSAYIADGKTFAYKFYGVITGYAEKGYRIYAGAALTVDYVDEDGDGKFETCYLNSSRNKHPSKIPDWIPKNESKIIISSENIPSPPLFKSSP